MRRPRRLLWPRALWVGLPILLAVQVVHPGQPLTTSLWRSFGTYEDAPRAESVRARRTSAGQLEVLGRVERTSRWLGSSKSEVELELLVAHGQLLGPGSRYRCEGPLPIPADAQVLGGGEDRLPVVACGGWVYPGYECVVLGPRPYWTSALAQDGESFVGHRVDLPLAERGDLPGALPARVLLSLPAVALDLLAAPRILGQLLVLGATMRGVAGH